MWQVMMEAGRWVSVRAAAAVLGFTVVSLRRCIERHARKTASGIEASFDGVRARKLGRTWRVALGSSWLVSPSASSR